MSSTPSLWCIGIGKVIRGSKGGHGTADIHTSASGVCTSPTLVPSLPGLLAPFSSTWAALYLVSPKKENGCWKWALKKDCLNKSLFPQCPTPGAQTVFKLPGFSIRTKFWRKIHKMSPLLLLRQLTSIVTSVWFTGQCTRCSGWVTCRKQAGSPSNLPCPLPEAGFPTDDAHD